MWQGIVATREKLGQLQQSQISSIFCGGELSKKNEFDKFTNLRLMPIKFMLLASSLFPHIFVQVLYYSYEAYLKREGLSNLYIRKHQLYMLSSSCFAARLQKWLDVISSKHL